MVSLKKILPVPCRIFLAYIESEIYESFNLRSSVQALVVGWWGSEIPRGLAMRAWLGGSRKKASQSTLVYGVNCSVIQFTK
ncbi:hypothetical protein GCM10020331_091510 [Ectobacillus funiculus]